MQVPSGGSVYERWVNTLRAWAKEPETVSLLELPPLDESTFTPDTYRRLIDHILVAMRTANDRWHEGLLRAWSRSSTPFELAHEMVALRTTLARRLQLAKHPGLPEAIRTALYDGLEKDIQRYQQEAEEAISRQRSATSLDSRIRDEWLAVVRENSFLAVLGYDVSGHRPVAAPLPERRAPEPVEPPSRTPHRRVVPIRES